MYLHHTLLLSCLVSLGLAIPAPTAAPTPTSALISQAASEPTKAPAPASYFTTTSHIIIPGQTKEHVTIPDKTIDITIPTCIRTLEPDENGYLPPGTCDSIYPYYPSFGAALAAAIFFGGLTIAHITQAAWTKKVGGLSTRV